MKTKTSTAKQLEQINNITDPFDVRVLYHIRKILIERSEQQNSRANELQAMNMTFINLLFRACCTNITM